MSLYMFRALNAHLQGDTLYTCIIWYCHSLREFVVTCRCTVCCVILCEYEALASLRLTHLVSFFLNPKDIRKLTVHSLSED